MLICDGPFKMGHIEEPDAERCQAAMELFDIHEPKSVKAKTKRTQMSCTFHSGLTIANIHCKYHQVQH